MKIRTLAGHWSAFLSLLARAMTAAAEDNSLPATPVSGNISLRHEARHAVEKGRGSLISLVTDPVALVNNTGPGHDNDLIWTPNTNNLPPADVPVEVTIRLEDARSK
jgi:hypothetical protein